jgi:hypothetical protein
MDSNIFIGGSVGEGAAVGPRARGGNVTQTTIGSSSTLLLLRRLDDLEREVLAHQAEIKDADELGRAIKGIRKEVSREKPRASTLNAALDQIMRSAGGVSAVADAVLKVRDVVAGLM